MKVKRTPDLPFQQILDEVLIVAPKDRRIHRLNEVGSHIWLQLDRPRTLEQLARSVAEEFEVDEKTASRDVKAFVSDLKQNGLATTQ